MPPIRFHDTRHTTASLLMMFGASPIAVQRILRHSDVRTTTDVYSHLAPDYLRAEINKLSFRPKPQPETLTLALSCGAAQRERGSKGTGGGWIYFTGTSERERGGFGGSPPPPNP